jgi:hypothetical protein
MRRLITTINLLLLCGCANSAEITQTWVAEDIKDKDLHGALVAAVACMRKQLTILNTMMKNGTHWDEKLA